ncbi:MAG: alpha/beta hydrolase [Natronomonas sp.]
MGLKRLLGGAAAGLAAVAAGNSVLQRSAGEMAPPLGRPMSTYRWRGFDVAYTEAGDPENPDLLLLHGINVAGSSHEFRYIVDALSEDYHVVAPDLPGFGHSDRPPLLYSGSLYVAFVRDFVADRTDRPTVVAQSLSAAYATAAVEELAEENKPREFVFICPAANAFGEKRPWLRSLLRSPVIGEGLYNLIASKPSIRYFLSDHGFAQEASVTEEWVNYDWTTTHQPGARYAPASFLAGFLSLDIDLGAAIEATEIPTTILWGEDTELPPPSVGEELAKEASARFLVFENADLLVHAEHPEEFVETFEDERLTA